MVIFKYLIGFIFASGSMQNPEADGWFPVEKIPKAEEVITDIDPSIWVLFSKKLGSEHFTVRLPDDPVYRSIEDGFILRSKNKGEIFEVVAQKGAVQDSPRDSLYELEGKWVHEHIVQSQEYTFKLRTYSQVPDSLNHDLFITSFSLR